MGNKMCAVPSVYDDLSSGFLIYSRRSSDLSKIKKKNYRKQMLQQNLGAWIVALEKTTVLLRN